MRIKRRNPSPVYKKARRGFRGYPVATVNFYGPDNTRASKVAVGIILEEGGEAVEINRWFSDDTDVRRDLSIAAEMVEFVREHGALSVIMADRMLGCPHEEGIDYPSGEVCPECPYWANRDRFTGELIN